MVDYNADIDHIRKDSMDQVLECGWSIVVIEGHHSPLKGTTVPAELRVPFITFAEDLGLASRVKKVGNVWQGMAVVLGDLVETSEVDKETKGTIHFMSEDDGGSV